MTREIHDASWSASEDILSLVAHLVPEDQKRALFSAIYARIKEAIRSHGAAAEDTRKRLHPGKN